MNLPRLLVTVSAVLLVTLPAVPRAQVAVPDFSPAAPRLLLPTVIVPEANFTPDNPGAMQWGAPSRFGVGRVTEAKVEVDTPGDFESTTDGNYGGLRWVGDRLAIGAEGLDLDTSGDSDYAAEVANGAVSLAVTEAIAVGGALNTATEEEGATTDETRGTLGGVSVTINETFFIGGALGRNDLERSNGASFDADRDVQMLGIGYRSGGNGTAIHLEYNTVSRAAYERPNGTEFDETDISRLVAEFNWGGLLLALQGASIEVDELDGDYAGVDVGYAPQQGLALVGHFAQASGQTAADNDFDTSVTAVSLAVQF